MGSPQVGMMFVLGLVLGFLSSFLFMSYGDFYTLEFKRDSTVNPLYSHEEVDEEDKQFAKSHNGENLNQLVDNHVHHDDSTRAEKLFKDVRVLVWIMTQPSNLESKAIHVNLTWGKRANKLLFASDTYDAKFPTLPITIAKGRNHLTAKTMAAFDYVYEHHLDEYDWFMKADDDTYVIMENLRYFLSNENTHDPVYFGHWFKTMVTQGYYSGGAGYVMSREALRRFGERKKGICASDMGAEDVQFGSCMQRLGVKTKATLDNLGRSRFHCFNAQTHLAGNLPDWYYRYDKYGGTNKGPKSMSDYPISFHYNSVQTMYDLEYYVYHLRPYGIQSGLEDLNVHYSAEADNPEINKPDVSKSNVNKPDAIKNIIFPGGEGINKALESKASLTTVEKIVLQRTTKSRQLAFRNPPNYKGSRYVPT